MRLPRSLAALVVLCLSLLRTGTTQVPSGPPRDVAAIAISSTAVRVTWSDVPTHERNGTLQTYEVLYEQSTFSEAPQSGSVVVAAELEDEATLDGLEEYVEYSVRIRASNGDGYGPFSAPVFVTTYQDVPSSPPLNVVLLSSELPNQLSLMWDRPPEIDINGLLLYYSLRYHRVGSDSFVLDALNASSDSTVLGGLDSYAVYEVFLAASTVNGSGPMTTLTAQTIETAPETAPLNFTANSSSPCAIDMEWRPPNESEWNGILRGYQLQYTRTDFISAVPESYSSEAIISSANQTTLALVDLCSSAVYCVRVAALTVGAGPYTSPLCLLTLPGTQCESDSNQCSSSNTSLSGDGELDNSTTNMGFNMTVNGTVPVNETESTGKGGLVGVVACSVVAAVVGVALVGGAIAVGVGLFVRQRRVKKSMNLAQYFTIISTETPHHLLNHHNQQQTQRVTADTSQEQDPADVTFTNPTALSFELQLNSSYNSLLPQPPPSLTASSSSDHGNEGETPSSSSVRIANNPQYNQFSSDQTSANNAGGVVSLKATESDYDYPATFRTSHTSGNDPYARVRDTSNTTGDDPPYATVT